MSQLTDLKSMSSQTKNEAKFFKTKKNKIENASYQN